VECARFLASFLRVFCLWQLSFRLGALTCTENASVYANGTERRCTGSAWSVKLLKSAA